MKKFIYRKIYNLLSQYVVDSEYITITEYMNPKVIVEIGTFTGMGVYSMIQGLNKGKIYTYDIVEWNKFETHLEMVYFDNGSVKQIISDLSNKNNFILNKDILNSAEMIFLDAPKNGVFEKKFLTFLTELNQVEKRILVIDDIKFMNMIDLWVNIKSPKIDLTSFGHWTGTGLVDISDGIKFW